MNDFNLIAPVYDTLLTSVFGRSMFKAQVLFLRDIPSHANVLIVGGGTGWLLAELLVLNDSCKVWYVEASSKMLKLSKDKVREELGRVVFFHRTQNGIPENVVFDVVITHCFLDLFSTSSCQSVIQDIKISMHEKGIWLITDFVNTTWWQSALLKLMYVFFKRACGIEAERLPPWKTLLMQNGLVIEKSKSFFAGFISSTLAVKKF